MGKLILIGGGETQEREHTVEAPLLSALFKDSTIENAVIIIAPSEEQEKVYNKYETAFQGLINQDLHFLFLKDEQAKDNDFAILKKADLIFFTGGDQKKIIRCLNKPMITLLHNRFKEENLLIAGTSAGAMILGSKMIKEGGNAKPQFNASIEFKEGINILSNTIIDTHFIERSRFARLAQGINHFSGMRGIGVETNTALWLEENSLAKVYGEGTVTFIASSPRKSQEKDQEKKIALHLQVNLLVSGCTFNLNTCQVSIP